MSISKKYYQRVTILYGIVVLFLSFVLPFLLKTSIDYWSVFFIIITEGIGGVVSFYFVENYSTLLIVNGKTGVNAIAELSNKSIIYIIKIVMACLKFPVALIQIGFIAGIAMKYLIIKLYTKKKYPWLVFDEKTTEKLNDRNSYIVTELAWTIFSATDMIILSIFCSTSLSSVYSVYNMIFTSLSLLLNAGYQAIVYLLSRNYFEDIENYKKMHNMFNSFFMSCITILMSTAYILSIPFVKLYTNGVADVNYIYKWLPLLFCIIQMLSWSRYVSGNLTGIAGYAKQTSYVSLSEAIVNIIASLILVQFFDIYGVIIASIIALPVKVIYTNYISEKKILKRNPSKTICILGINYLIFSLVVIVSNLWLNLNIDSYLEFVLCGFIIFILISLIVFAINAVCNLEAFSILKKTLLKRNKEIKN